MSGRLRVIVDRAGAWEDLAAGSLPDEVAGRFDPCLLDAMRILLLLCRPSLQSP
ncbi:hypothetical protein BBBF_0289 [Bifidobacterium bifidum ATCC 29521 = JCM 1255 = DSM 20456]|uniref:Uncharacterized protein n=1 Tax=Bifidobacterium bifidum ATCC 29521 = JCM 1255 = DSM 20456 TaxID=500634 RepID=A0ABM7EPX6_BIFBI|nr:hypothetical protein BIFBIF_01597 [Bifidobacterium bifidum ATCC 29521 = JCM 1255 = DSM 20456]BAQ97496.1 hypothetical protein BBBF_0289 [Bifidobacterium bifidum ATCC 29521 = JCM 1255 = DSM 20456]